MARARNRKAGKDQGTVRSARHEGQPDRKRPRGRPKVHDEAWTKVTVVLFNRQIVFLDRLAADIRARSGAAISRAQIIRALLDSLGGAGVDLTASRSEADLTATLLARFGGRRRPPAART